MTGPLDNSLELILLAGKFHAKPQHIGIIGLADILGVGQFPLPFDIHRPGNTHADIPCLADGEQFSHFKLQEQRPRKFVVHQRSVVIIVVMQADASRDFYIRIKPLPSNSDDWTILPSPSPYVITILVIALPCHIIAEIGTHEQRHLGFAFYRGCRRIRDLLGGVYRRSALLRKSARSKSEYQCGTREIF